jgi:ABC-type polar amino acid transport system ATPase subunit
MTEPGAVLEMHGIRKRFGSNEVLKGIDFAVRRGEVLAIIGPSGSGKSTLARCISLIEEPDHGEIRFLGCCLVHDPGVRLSLAARWRRHQEIARLRRSTSMVFQQFNLFPHLSVLQNVTLALRKVKKLPTEAATTEALAQLARVGLSDKRDAYPGTLSGGQQQRVAIARALVNSPALLLADEPTGNLDEHTAASLHSLLREMHAEQRLTSVIATHNSRLAEGCDRVLRLEDGRLRPV